MRFSLVSGAGFGVTPWVGSADRRFETATLRPFDLSVNGAKLPSG
jgi:hypothetical protein